MVKKSVDRAENWLALSFFFQGNSERSRVKLPYGIDKVYVAIYDYDARTDEDLTFRVGDLLIILDDRYVSSWLIELRNEDRSL